MQVPAIITAGDGHASRAVHGRSKVYLEIDGRPLVAHAVSVLQRVPEVSEVWVVGNAERLERVFAQPELRRELRKPLHVVPQFRNLYENGWQTFRRLLPGAGPDGRDPGPDEADARALFLSADLPFATPQEISEFTRRGVELDCDYALGLVTEQSMQMFYPAGPGNPGIRMAYFNLREGRFRQSNLHLIKPARIGNRFYIEEMYELRYQREFWTIAALAWRLLVSERRGLVLVGYYLLIQMASIADRRGWRALADRVRRWIPLSRVEEACSKLLSTNFRTIVTDVGGCGVDIDNDQDFDVARLRFSEWYKAQLERAEERFGPLPLPAGSSAATREPGDGEPEG